MTAPRVWFITGASRGLGRAIAEAALAAGDRVVGAARNVAPLEDLGRRYPGQVVALPLDVADRTAVHAAVDDAVGAFGRLDIVVNNAGGMLLGMVEETTEEQIRAHFDVNLFGAVWVTQAVIPQLRKQGYGHLLQVTSMGSGGGVASVGMYAAGKSALDALSQSAAMELAPFGVKVTIVQPGGYDTGLYTVGTTMADPRPEYDQLRAELAAMWGDDAGPAPSTAAPVVMTLVDLPEPPLRLIVGGQSFDIVDQMERARRDERLTWEHLSRQAPG